MLYELNDKMNFQRHSLTVFCKCSMLFMLIVKKSNIVVAEFGGQDLFTSLAQLEVLWQNERKVVQQMESTIEKMETALQSLKM